MSAKWEKQEGTNEGKLTFEIAPEQVKEGLDIAFNRVKKSLNVPGFRKGKVPRQIFNKMYGEEALYQTLFYQLLMKLLSRKQISSQWLNLKLMLNRWKRNQLGF